ncbi:MAG: glutamate--tRNA ligase [Dehalococcoidia bacterium]|jgi:glutamyl-tRNA synthetase|nr:glutamate--tRNA ligase [Dehalococcoidia bacterium]
MTVRVRFPPSPTGEPHVGNLRTALFNWLFARHHGGVFILRIEDTDRERQVPGAVEAIMDALLWLGLSWDEGPHPQDPSRDVGPFGPYVQSRRLELYQRHARLLVEAGHAYYCYCSPERLERVRQEMMRRRLPPRYDRHCRDLSQEERQALEASGVTPVVRFKTPLSGETSFHDLIRGQITVRNETLDDFVLLKSDGYPVYHLASVVDDHFMRVSHVLRGEEWIPSTPRHVLLYEAFGWEPPKFAHLPIILGPDRAKLSKRHGDTSVRELRERGYLPEALFNFLGLLGWSLDDHTEIISRETFIRHFDLDRVSPSPAIFNREKLDWMNGVYIRSLSSQELAQRLKPYLARALGPVDDELLLRATPLLQERIRTLAEAVEMAAFLFLPGEVEFSLQDLLGKRFADSPQEAARALAAAIEGLETLASWDAQALEALLRPMAQKLGLKTGDFFMLLRVAVTGRTVSPPLFQSMELVGKERTLLRLRSAVARLQPYVSAS